MGWFRDSGSDEDAAEIMDAAVGAPVDAGSVADADTPAVDAAALAASLRALYGSYSEVSVPADNPLSADKVLLGKALFWDTQLSSDATVACGTCHRPEAGGADPRTADPGYRGHPGADGLRDTADDPRGSQGIRRCEVLSDGGIAYVADPSFGDLPQVTRRRSMSFVDAMFPAELFWDGRAGTVFTDPQSDGGVVLAEGAALESQAVGPILNSAEMACVGSTWDMVVARVTSARPLALAPNVSNDLVLFIAGIDHYSTLFELVFGDSVVTAVRIAMAIASYERTLTANQTPWDRFIAGDVEALTDQQLSGLTVFVGKGSCFACHTPPLFGFDNYVDDGFVVEPWDLGRQEVTGLEVSRGAFRVVSLRNVGLREAGGLLHDGLFPGTDLDTLVHQYNQPPVYGPGPFRRALHLTEQEMVDLAAFVRGGLTDPRMAASEPPFDHPSLPVP